MGTTPDVGMEEACRNCVHRKTGWLCGNTQSPQFREHVGPDDVCHSFGPSKAQAHFIRAGSTSFLLLNTKSVQEKEGLLNEIVANYTNAIRAGLPAEDEIGAKFGLVTSCAHVIARQIGTGNMSPLNSDLMRQVINSLREAGEEERKHTIHHIAQNWYQLGFTDLLLDLKAAVIGEQESPEASERFVREQLEAVHHVTPTPLPKTTLRLAKYLARQGKHDASVECAQAVLRSISRKEGAFLPTVGETRREAIALSTQDSSLPGDNQRIPVTGQNRRTANPPKKGGCFIATAVYGSDLAPEIILLSRFRDDVLLKSRAGRLFVTLYYSVSPPIARLINGREFVRRVTRLVLLKPTLYFLGRLFRSMERE